MILALTHKKRSPTTIKLVMGYSKKKKKTGLSLSNTGRMRM